MNLYTVNDGIPADCILVCDLTFDVGEKEHASLFSISTCKDNSLDDGLTNSLYKPGLAQRTGQL